MRHSVTGMEIAAERPGGGADRSRSNFSKGEDRVAASAVAL